MSQFLFLRCSADIPEWGPFVRWERVGQETQSSLEVIFGESAQPWIRPSTPPFEVWFDDTSAPSRQTEFLALLETLVRGASEIALVGGVPDGELRVHNSVDAFMNAVRDELEYTGDSYLHLGLCQTARDDTPQT